MITEWTLDRHDQQVMIFQLAMLLLVEFFCIELFSPTTCYADLFSRAFYYLRCVNDVSIFLKYRPTVELLYKVLGGSVTFSMLYPISSKSVAHHKEPYTITECTLLLNLYNKALLQQLENNGVNRSFSLKYALYALKFAKYRKFYYSEWPECHDLSMSNYRPSQCICSCRPTTILMSRSTLCFLRKKMHRLLLLSNLSSVCSCDLKTASSVLQGMLKISEQRNGVACNFQEVNDRVLVYTVCGQWCIRLLTKRFCQTG